MDEESRMVAPCGMDCRLCLGHQRTERHCAGCRNEADILYKTKGSRSCVIKHCAELEGSSTGFCFECGRFPCARLKQLDKRYRARYGMSMLENLAAIRDQGMETFLAGQSIRWTCPSCGSLLCVHRPACLQCGAAHPASGV